MISIRSLDLNKDYETIASWFKSLEKRGWYAPPKELLPFGMGAEVEGELVCVSFLYMDKTTPFAFLEWTIANPNPELRQYRKRCVKLVLTSLINYATLQGNKIIFSSTKNSGLLQTLMNLGFEQSDRNITNLIYKINGGSNNSTSCRRGSSGGDSDNSPSVRSTAGIKESRNSG